MPVAPGYMAIGSTLHGDNYYVDSFTLNDTALVTINLSTADCGGGLQTLGCPLVDMSSSNGDYFSITSSGNYTYPCKLLIFSLHLKV